MKADAWWRQAWWRWAAVWLVPGAVLRALLIYFPRSGDDDTDAYLELGRNLLHHGTYGMMTDGEISPSLFRLPGYPIFLALLGGRITLVLVVQSGFCLLGALLLGLFVRRYAGPRAGLWTVGLAATCLFTAAYAASPLTESLSVFAASLAIWGVGDFLAGGDSNKPDAFAASWSMRARRLLPAATGCALAMLLRPDGALLTVAVAVALLAYGSRRIGWPGAAVTAVLLCALASVPLVPWTVRNAVTFHECQPLAPRHVNDPGERVNLGFYRWMRTWSVDFSSTADVFWHVGTEPIALGDLPARAFDSPAERAETAALLDRYNRTKNVDQPLDDDFGRLAEQRIRAHPLRYYVFVPLLRIADMSLHPRTDAMALPADWRNAAERSQRLEGWALGLLNLVYLGLALTAAARGWLPLPWLLGTVVLLRCCLLGTIENAEPRYTLELYPVVLVGAGIAMEKLERRLRSTPGP